MTAMLTLGRPNQAPGVITPVAWNHAITTAWPSANRAFFSRFWLPTAGRYRWLRMGIGLQSGNVQLAVVRLSADGASYTRVMSTGVVPCPAAGNAAFDVGATVLQSGDHALVAWADNTTVQVPIVLSGTAALTALGQFSFLSNLASGVPASGSGLVWSAGSPVIMSLGRA